VAIKPRVDETVRAAAWRLSEAGMRVRDVELPWHRHAMAVWNVIATDGARAQMIEGNGYGFRRRGSGDTQRSGPLTTLRAGAVAYPRSR
jgi:amidase